MGENLKSWRNWKKGQTSGQYMKVSEMLNVKDKNRIVTDTLNACRHQTLLFLLRNNCISKVRCLMTVEAFEMETLQCDTFHVEEHISLLLLGGIISIFNTFKAFSFKESQNNRDIPIQVEVFPSIYLC